jgi:metallophosphoesterase superfamily enzyme
MSGVSGTPDDSVDPNVLHDTLLGLVGDVKAEFGEREPTEEELRRYLADRLRNEGKSDAEIEEILGALG